MTLNDRIKIQAGLEEHRKLKVIAEEIDSDPRTVSKEVKKRRIMDPNRKRPLPPDSTAKDICKTVLRFPFVCNGCIRRNQCTNPHFFTYNAAKAQEDYSRILHECRQGMDMTLSEKETIDALLKAGSDNGQSVSHIYQAHKKDIVCNESTLYRMIENGTTITQKIDTRRSARLKPRKHYASKQKKDPAFMEGRRYSDFIAFISTHIVTNLVEIDTVEDPSNGAGKTLLTIHFTALHFMIIRLLKKKTKEEVDRQFVWLREKLGDTLYSKMFSVILTDGGIEFSDPAVIEGMNGHLFYCEAYSSYQKGAIEENHTLIRYVLPKGTYFDFLTQKLVDLLASHLNSYYRNSTGSAPYSLFIAFFGKETAVLLNIILIPSDDVCLKSTLLK